MKQSLIKRIKNNRKHAVSEVVGTILLLGIAVTLFSVIYTMVLSTPYSPPTPTANIAYSLNDNNLTLTNLGGKTLGLGTKIKILINDTLYKTYNLTTTWGIGQQLIFDLSGYINDIDYSVEVLVIDSPSNSIVMMGKTSIKNRPPIISIPEPYNDQNNVAITLASLNISISEPDNDAFYYTIETTPDIGYKSGYMKVYPQNNFQCNISGLAEDTKYTWFVNATDINGKSTQKTFTFTTGIIEPTIDHKDDIDNNSSDVDNSPDKGIETYFNNCKANITDTQVMIIQEISSSGNDVNTNLPVNGFTSTWTAWGPNGGNSPYLDASDNTNYIFETSGDLDDMAWFTFDNTTATGSGITTHLWVEFDKAGGEKLNWYIDITGDNTPEFSGIYTASSPGTYDMGEVIGLDDATEINAARLWCEYDYSGSSTDMQIDYAYLEIKRYSNYNIDFEYQFTGANYSDTHEQLCMYVTSCTGTEPLYINYWDGDSWELLGIITGTGWKNVTATGLTSSIYTIQLIGLTETSDTEQGDWNIDCIYLHTWNN